MEVKSYPNKMSAQFYAYYPVGHTCLMARRFTADPPAGEAGTQRSQRISLCSLSQNGINAFVVE